MSEQNPDAQSCWSASESEQAMYTTEEVLGITERKERFALNLKVASHAYLFGFLQADGHLYQNTRNRGRVTIEVSAKDTSLLQEFSRLVPFYSSVTTRTRSTNFSKELVSACWSVHDQRFRQSLLNLGFPAGKKSYLAAVPNVEVSTADYFRGLIDADGSLGMTANGFPFLALVTASESLANAFAAFILEVTGKRKHIARNARDKIYNITVFKEDAQSLAAKLYYDGCLGLSRKLQKAQDVIRWQRLANMRRVFQKKSWSLLEDKFIRSHSLTESIATLARTERSIKMRLWRLDRAGTGQNVW